MCFFRTPQAPETKPVATTPSLQAPAKTDADVVKESEAEARRRRYSVNGLQSLFTGAGDFAANENEEDSPRIKRVSLGA
jgi:hypothetical protein